MPSRRSRVIRRSVALAMLVILVGSVITGLLTRERLPRALRIASGTENGRYHEFALRLGPAIERESGRSVTVLKTDGSVASWGLLHSKDPAQRRILAILQSGSVPLDGLVMIAPLFPDVVHVVARVGRGIESIDTLKGHRVSIGPPESGMKVSAQHLLDHYGIDLDDLDARAVGFDQFEADDTIDAAIVTTNPNNPGLRQLLAGGDFLLIPIDDAEAIALRFYHYRAFTIPQGLFCESPQIPPKPVPTIASTAFLAARSDAPVRLVEEALEALYNEIGPWDFIDLIPRSRALDQNPAPMHPAARSFFDPFDQLGWTAAILESLSALKELLVALAAGATCSGIAGEGSENARRWRSSTPRRTASTFSWNRPPTSNASRWPPKTPEPSEACSTASSGSNFTP